MFGQSNLVVIYFSNDFCFQQIDQHQLNHGKIIDLAENQIFHIQYLRMAIINK